ncbi:hypothetical protein [Nocardiopsis tropica]|uniref:Uncharacterized protein n=1 Tax=Nocardiopsis tropica TaxID=109330 RepID=A0ABU7KYP2_9ACTN|nr:hypothetical protein [Nocardiopsis umidischolae]MEE2054384.1 hypothetical protein [Nocardiopsis umidischolae]
MSETAEDARTTMPPQEWQDWGKAFTYTPILNAGGHHMADRPTGTVLLLYNDTRSPCSLHGKQLDGGAWAEGNGTRFGGRYGLPPRTIEPGGGIRIQTVGSDTGGAGGQVIYGFADSYYVLIQWDNRELQKNHYEIGFFTYDYSNDPPTRVPAPDYFRIRGLDWEGRRIELTRDHRFDSDDFGAGDPIVGFTIGLTDMESPGGPLQLGTWPPEDEDQRVAHHKSLGERYGVKGSELRRMWVEEGDVVPAPGVWLGMVYGCIDG